MILPALFAFLHHVAAFALVAALVVEFVLIREEITLQAARRLLLADLVYGAAAGSVLVVGLLRVFFFEKGAGYYLHSAPFIAKVSLFALIALLSIYPTVVFLSWRPSVKLGRPPPADARRIRRIRSLIHWELAGVVVLIFCAALMAKGIGVLG
jgi:putative membrane protein